MSAVFKTSETKDQKDDVKGEKTDSILNDYLTDTHCSIVF